jgi:hypothetical protein
MYDVQCRSVLSIDTFHMYQLIIRDLCQLMSVWSKYCTVQSSVGAGTIFRLTERSLSFAGFCELDRQVHFN